MFHRSLKPELERERDARFLDEMLPALDDHTPREAARDPALRPRLVTLIKNRIQAVDENNLKKGGNYDINWLVEELGLTEIHFPPPPARPRPAPLAGENEDDGEEDEGDG